MVDQKSKVTVNVAATNVTDSLDFLGKNYTGSFGCSNEQVFSPVATSRDLNAIHPTPGFQFPAQAILYAEGEFEAQHVGPTDIELDPYFTFGDPRYNTDFEVVIHNEETDDIHLGKSNVQALTHVRTTGLRGPILLSGWGYGLDDTPVPAKGAAGDDKFKFVDDVGLNRSLWKTGPIDLKWDR